MTNPSEPMPPLPDGPLRPWHQVERDAIGAYGQQCAAAERKELAALKADNDALLHSVTAETEARAAAEAREAKLRAALATIMAQIAPYVPAKTREDAIAALAAKDAT